MAKKQNNKKETAIINLDGKDYSVDNMNDKQKTIISHITDLTRKMESTQFNLQQMQVGKDAFVGLLKTELTEDENTDK
jgi:hypothetical protein